MLSGLVLARVCSAKRGSDPLAAAVDTLGRWIPHPFIMECTGEADEHTITPAHPGVSLNEPAAGADPDRTILSECHAMGSRTGAFMVRLESYEYVHYVACPRQLFGPAYDPEELTDLAGDPACDSVRLEARGRLRSRMSTGPGR